MKIIMTQLRKQIIVACVCFMLINLCACSNNKPHKADSVIVGAGLQGEGGSPLYKKSAIDQIDSDVHKTGLDGAGDADAAA
jgi:hypothetical protein